MYSEEMAPMIGGNTILREINLLVLLNYRLLREVVLILSITTMKSISEEVIIRTRIINTR